MESNCPPSDRIPVGHFVFGYVLFGMVLMMLLFIVTAIQKFDEIIDRYSTISDYCTNPKQFGSRFLLLVTTLVGVTLALAYVAAYNSIPAGTTASVSQKIRFFLRLVAAMLFPLVGLFYVSYEEGEKYDFGAFQMSVKISCWIHVVVAMFYFFVNSVLNLWDSIGMIVHDSPATGTAWTLFALSVIGLASFLAFVIAQAFTYLAPPLDPKEKREALERYRELKRGLTGTGKKKSPEFMQFDKDHPGFTRMRLVYALSFLFETTMVIIVTLTALLIATAKNNCISLLK